MVQNVSDVLISQSIVKRNSGDAEEQAGDVGESPFNPVLGEQAEQLHFFPFRDIEEVLLNDPTSDVVASSDGLLVSQVFDGWLIVFRDDFAFVFHKVPSAGLSENFLRELRITCFIVSSWGLEQL